MVTALASGSRGPGSRPGLVHGVAFLGNRFFKLSHYLSPPRCINGYRWIWSGGVNLRWTSISSRALMSRIERKYCLISASYLAGLIDIFIWLHIWQNFEFCWLFYQRGHFVMLIIRNMNRIGVQSWTYLIQGGVEILVAASCYMQKSEISSGQMGYLARMQTLPLS